VRENNIYVESFPSNIIAGMFNFGKGTFFEIDKTETVVPNVSF
jgi:LemA protein